MSTYREIHGKGVKSLGTDPSATTDAGQIWYNTSSNTFKSIVNIAAWSSSSNTINALYRRASAGPTTAAFLAGGDSGPGPSVSNLTEEWDGSGFSVGGTLNTGRYSAGGAGTLTAGLAFGGGTNPTPPNYQTATESYNGTAWTNSPNGLNTARFVTQGVGTTTAALCMGGLKSPSNTASNDSEEWGGTSWTAGNTLNTARESAAQAGIQTAALLAGGYSTTYSAVTESYDGTTWTNVNSMNTARFSLGGAGTQTAAVAYGGDKNPSALTGATESWDGTNWATSPASLATARTHVGDFGSSTNAFAAGGYTPPATTVTEEFNSSTNTVTAAAWASATAMPEKNYGAGSFGSQDAYLYFGGSPYPAKTDATREYDGTNWTTTGNYTGSLIYLGGCGTQTAGLGAGGFPPSHTAAAEYDGSSWTAVNSMSQARMNTGSTYVGIQTAALVVGGDQFPSTPRSLTACEEYDGTNWSTGGVWPTPVQNTAQGGTQAAGWAAGGLKDSSPGSPNVTQDATNEYDGSSWTASGALPTATMRAGSAGTQTAGLLFAGINTANTATSYSYDGTAWATNPSMATARQSIGGAGVSSPGTAAIGAGGYVSPNTTTAVEEFTGQTSTVNIEDVTTS